MEKTEQRLICNTNEVTDTPDAWAPEAFTSTPCERRALLPFAIVAYIYVLGVLSDSSRTLWLTASAALLCIVVGFTTRNEPRSRERWVWLGCLWTTIICCLAGRCRAWSAYAFLIAHGFAAYWLIVCTGRLHDRITSRYLPFDLFYGLCVYPFSNFLLRFRVFRTLFRRDRQRTLSGAALVGSVFAVAASLGLLAQALCLLSRADPNFERIANDLSATISDVDPYYIICLLLSLPLGALLFGMVFGALRASAEAVVNRRQCIDRFAGCMRRIPQGLWTCLLSLFEVLYALFFIIQGSYLFNGLRGLLPEQFTAAQYARRGFFELCGVMGVNFVLLGAATLSIEGGLRSNKTAAAACGVVLGESALLAVTTAAKLAMYIRRFGFTPLRIQSAWLVLVLLAGTVCALRALLSGRDTVRGWAVFSGITLAFYMLW